jgi:hypothetical protein
MLRGLKFEKEMLVTLHYYSTQKRFTVAKIKHKKEEKRYEWLSSFLQSDVRELFSEKQRLFELKKMK